MLSVLIQSGGTNGLQFASCQRRLKDIGSIDGAFCGTGTYKRMKFINKHNYVACTAQLIHQFTQALFKLTAILGACHHRSQFKRDHTLVFQRLRHLGLNNTLGQPLGNGSLAYTRLSD
jgi:hypothetical protein